MDVESTAKLLSAVASLAWPLIFAAIVYSLFGPIKGLVESARTRKFSINVAGNQLSMEEASEQQRALMSDVQLKIAELQKQVGDGAMAMAAPLAETVRSGRQILWVDDQPRNNSFLMETLASRGFRIDTALSTDAALERVKAASYDVIISDMGRPEGDRAGIDLARKLKAMGVAAPIYIFCGQQGAASLRQEALHAGVTDITSSATTLLSLLPLPGSD